jgi:hypothetical protein
MWHFIFILGNYIRINLANFIWNYSYFYSLIIHNNFVDNFI